MRILMVMPRNMRFGPSNASSIDLCVRDLVLASRFRSNTTVICCENDTLFSDVFTQTYSKVVDASKSKKIALVRNWIRTEKPDLVVVQQHLPTAARLARSVSAPVIFHTHNMSKGLKSDSIMSNIRRRLKLRDYRSLSGLIFVSTAASLHFERNWPDVKIPKIVVPNGLKFADWRPVARRAKEILCVGRAAPEKGILEAAMAIARVLPSKPEWSARFILAEINRFPSYVEEVKAALNTVSDRVTIEYQQPFSVVKQRCESAAIAVVASRWEEPFGRTSLEAHAGGCCVISSRTGGLREVSGDCAMGLPKDFTYSDIADALELTMGNARLREMLSVRGRSRCLERFQIESISYSADDFYESVVDRKTSTEEAAGRVRLPDAVLAVREAKRMKA